MQVTAESMFKAQIALVVAALAFLGAGAVLTYQQASRQTRLALALTNVAFLGAGLLAVTMAFVLWPHSP
jgi:hypothetical protein